MKTAKLQVQEYLKDAEPGEVIYYRDLADKFGYTYPSVSNVLANLAREDNSPVRPGPSAGYYVVVERKPAAGAAMEVVGTMKDGALLLRDADRAMWRATPL